MTLLATLVVVAAALAPQNIQLPPQPAPGRPVEAQRPQAEIERFKRDLQELRAGGPQIERTLQRMANEYPRIETLIIERLRAARARELQDLMLVARRFGSPPGGKSAIADEILFQLLARPVAEATATMVDALAELKGDEARPALQQLVLSRIAAARRAAVERLARMATAEDLPFALQLSGEQSLDLQLAAVTLLAAIPDLAGSQRLCELLAKNPTVAGAACAALIRGGGGAAPALQELLAQPVIDRAPLYAAFALACIGGRDGSLLLPPGALQTLITALRSDDALARSLAVVPLAALAFSGHDVPGQDSELVSALIDVVEPTSFVPNLELLRRPCFDQLVRLTGRPAGLDNAGWREWWRTARADFVGMRARIDFAAADYAVAVIVYRDDATHVRFYGEGLADVAPVDGASEFVLDEAQMRQLIERLQQAGFDTAASAPNMLPPARHLQLRVRDARTQVTAPAASSPAFDALIAIVREVAEQELWQLLRHPAEEPERGAFWRAERRWLAGSPAAPERLQRLLQRLLRVWSITAPKVRGRALAWLFSHPQRREAMTEQIGEQILAALRRIGELGEQEQMLLQLAADATGDRVWREALDVARRLPGGGKRAVEQLFALLGADRVLAALNDERPEVRRAAIDEVVRGGDLRGGETVLRLFDDPDPEVARSAVFAAGELRLAAARPLLIDRIADAGTSAEIRRQALRALGRIGGDGAFAVLQRALGATMHEDRDAALRGLGELRDARAAKLLAEIFVAGPDTTSGQLARFYLERMGHEFAVPALRAMLRTPNPAIRTQVVLMLGGYQDPEAVPELIALLRQEVETLAAANLLGATTGVDLTRVEDRLAVIERWWRANREGAQWQWLVQALDREQVRHSLLPSQFVVGAGLEAVPELARLLVELDSGRLRVLVAAVLRTVSGEEFGIVTPATTREQREVIASRYRLLYESARAARGR